jgi:aminoglycoside phosphotransferase (APT) family kinase protein
MIEFDIARLDSFIRDSIPGLEGSISLERITGGQSNPTFFVSYENREMVLRKKPPGQLLPSAHAVDREARVLTALARTNVPVPSVILFQPDIDIIGTPFYLMERVPGRVFASGALEGVAPVERKAMYFSLAETLSALHDVDWKAIGLEGYGKPGNYFERQIKRWSLQWEAAKFREIPDLSRLSQWLTAHVPPDDGQTSICHGDYRIGNVMFHPSEPRVVAVLDWELSTIGHPLADLAFSVLTWRTRPNEYGGIRGLDLSVNGVPSESDYLDHYYGCRRWAVGKMTEFHVAFSVFRFAVIFEGIAGRARANNAAAANATEVGDLSLRYARLGMEIAGE